MDLAWVRLVRGEFGRLQSPEEATAYPYTPQEQAVVRARRAIQFIGSPATVRTGISVLKQTDQSGIPGAGCSFHPEASMSNGQNDGQFWLPEPPGIRAEPWRGIFCGTDFRYVLSRAARTNPLRAPSVIRAARLSRGIWTIVLR
ncbi:hypothetical protein BH23GEM5_BH23GEM5_28080 [soil metagenome]